MMFGTKIQIWYMLLEKLLYLLLVRNQVSLPISQMKIAKITH